MLEEESARQFYQDFALGVVFLILLGIASRRIYTQFCVSAGSATEDVIATLNCLIVFTAGMRTVWFLIPSFVTDNSFTPKNISAFKEGWIQISLAQVLVSFGSLSLFSIIILFTIYWSNLLKKIYRETTTRSSNPRVTFWTSVGLMCAFEVLNICLFFGGAYSSDGMILMDSCFFLLLSLVCSIEISLYSHRFRTVLQTLGAVNQVSTEKQVKRIVWITISSNVFLLVRGTTDIIIGTTAFLYWKKHGEFGDAVSADLWASYMLVRYASEALLVLVILYILGNSFGSQTVENAVPNTEYRESYQDIEQTDEWNSLNRGNYRYMAVENISD